MPEAVEYLARDTRDGTPLGNSAPDTNRQLLIDPVQGVAERL
jgi:hypothetical protein